MTRRPLTLPLDVLLSDRARSPTKEAAIRCCPVIGPRAAAAAAAGEGAGNDDTSSRRPH